MHTLPSLSSLYRTVQYVLADLTVYTYTVHFSMHTALQTRHLQRARLKGQSHQIVWFFVCIVTNVYVNCAKRRVEFNIFTGPWDYKF
jgi:hypothetical protein